MALGDVLDSFASPGSIPYGLAWDGTNLWVADDDTHLIYKLDPTDGNVLDSFATPGQFPRGLAWDGTNLWHLDGSADKIYKLDPNTGATLTFYGAPDSVPTSLAWGDSSLWTIGLTTDTIYKLNPDTGSVLDSFAAPADNPRGLAWDGTNLWVGDITTDTIYKLNPDTGSVLDSFAAPAGDPSGLTWDGLHLWSVDVTTDTIYKHQINQAPNAPLVSDQGTFDRNSVNRVTWTFSDADAGDSQSAAEVRYRENGTSTWTTVNIGNPNQFWDSPAGTFVADLYEAQVRTADQAGAWGPFSASFFITAGDAPPGPTFLDPINGQTIGQASYSGTISASDVDESEWTLYGDSAGAIDIGSVVQGPVVKATGDLRSHTFVGLANNVPVWWSVRVKHDGLWSQPAQIRTPVSYTPPPSPVVTYTQVPAEGAVDITITNPAPGTGEPATSYNDVLIRDPGGDYERRATNVAPNSTWRYWTPAHGWDPGPNVRVTAVGDNSTTVTTEGASEA